MRGCMNTPGSQPLLLLSNYTLLVLMHMKSGKCHFAGTAMYNTEYLDYIEMNAHKPQRLKKGLLFY